MLATGMDSDTDKINTDACYAFIGDNLFAVHPDRKDSAGIEVEAIPILNPSELVPFVDTQTNLRMLLHELALAEDWASSFRRDDPYALDSLRIELDGHLTFEPAGQIEYSSLPADNIKPLLAHTDAVFSKIASHLAQHNISLLQIGINPWHTVEQLGLQVKKQHYLLMQEHFKRFAPIGLRMMHQTCAIQTNLDYGNNDQLFVKRYLACLLIAPYSAAIFANSAVWDQTSSDCLGFRSQIWRTADASRTGFPALTKVFNKADKQACIDSYAEFALNARVIALVNDKHLSGATFRDWIAKGSPTLTDFQTHLHTLFPEVRPQRYFELRSVDGQAPVWQYVPLGFYLGLIYCNANLEQVLARLMPEWETIDAQMHLARQGLQGRDDKFITNAKWLLELATNANLPQNWQDVRMQRAMRGFAEHFTYQEKTPADEIKDIFTASGRLHPRDLQALNEEWEKIV